MPSTHLHGIEEETTEDKMLAALKHIQNQNNVIIDLLQSINDLVVELIPFPK